MSKDLNELIVALTGLVARINAIIDNVSPEAKQAADETVKAPKPWKFQLEEKCPRCGRPLVRRWSLKNHEFFVGCTGFRKGDESSCGYTTTWDSARYNMLDKTHQNDLAVDFEAEQEQSGVTFVAHEPSGTNRFAMPGRTAGTWNGDGGNPPAYKVAGTNPEDEEVF